MDNQTPSERGFVAQRSELWHKLRLGKMTSSKASVFVAESQKKGEPNAAFKKYLMGQIMELSTGRSKVIKAASLTNGNDWEPFAKQIVANKYQAEYFEMEFIQHPTLIYYGGSSDGSIMINGMEVTPEIKCPVWEEHLYNIKYFSNVDTIKKNYPEIYWQAQSNMNIQKTKLALAVTFHSEVAEDLRYRDLMIPRNQTDIDLLEAKMAEAWIWYQAEAKYYGIDIEARYKEFATVVPDPIVNVEDYAR